MERTKNSIITFLLLLLFLSANASYRSEIYSAYISNNMAKWKTAMDRMNLESNRNNAFLLEILNYQYGYIGFCVGSQNEDEAKKYIALALKNIEILEKAKFNLADVLAVKSAVYAYRIGINKMQAPFLGPKSMSYATQAIKADKENPMGYIQVANSEFYRPPAFGGSKTLALEYYLKAEKLMEKNQQNLKENWNYLSLLTSIVMCYKELKQYRNAKIYCDKALKVEPEYLWIKIDLLPKIETLLKESK